MIKIYRKITSHKDYKGKKEQHTYNKSLKSLYNFFFSKNIHKLKHQIINSQQHITIDIIAHFASVYYLCQLSNQ